MNEHIVRDAAREDFSAIEGLNSRWVHFTSPLTVDDIAHLHSMAAYHKVIEIDGRVVAFLIAFCAGVPYESVNYRWFSDRGSDFIYIDRIVIDAFAQGKGLGTLLYNDLFDVAHQESLSCVTCEIDKDPPNESSQRFHDFLGFVEVGTQWVANDTKQVSLRERKIE